MKISIIIPARYNSSRFPGKPLIDLNGKSMIQRVYDGCASALSRKDVYVATESDLIKYHCYENDMNVLITSNNSMTGTDRVYEASQQIETDLIVNVQGDLPLITGGSIKKIIDSAILDPEMVHYGMSRIDREKDFRNFNISKVVTDINNNLLYVSRGSIPVTRNNVFKGAMKTASVFVLPKNILKSFAEQKTKTPLESIEDIEILRFLELGHRVKMVEIDDLSISIDIPDDAIKVRKILNEREI
jgi:3-deoxy-manno-octulosonate cytidylyltransferase (CMP-KDO synthetase)